jgi:hypothetical protein
VKTKTAKGPVLNLSMRAGPAVVNEGLAYANEHHLPAALLRPLAHARHYLGSTRDLDRRIAAHRDGQGARLMEVVAVLGIEFEVARTWTGGRDLERKLKNQHHGPRLCPICTPRVTP